jgi:AbrB family looped-hinge helix DNA binding protein
VAKFGALLIKIKVDTRGRITIPKSIRDRLNLAPGATLELEMRSADLLLKPLFVMKDNFWVYMGAVPADINWDTLMDDDREQRIEDIWNSGTE